MALFVAALMGACGSATSDDPWPGTGDEAGAGQDATEDGTADASSGPSPDAIVLNDGSHSDGPIVSKTCAGLPDGTLCGPTPDACHDAPACSGGVCGGAKTKADGFQWMAGDDTARCCGGQPVHTDSDSNCGACGIQCNGSNGESCQVLAGHYFCRGCVASAACWSHCCSELFSPYSCAASDCSGNCSDQYCPPGTHCVSGGTTSSNYCSY
jgi:hypothetical protein